MLLLKSEHVPGLCQCLTVSVFIKLCSDIPRDVPLKFFMHFQSYLESINWRRPPVLSAKEEPHDPETDHEATWSWKFLGKCWSQTSCVTCCFDFDSDSQLKFIFNKSISNQKTVKKCKEYMQVKLQHTCFLGVAWQS